MDHRSPETGGDRRHTDLVSFHAGVPGDRSQDGYGVVRGGSSQPDLDTPPPDDPGLSGLLVLALVAAVYHAATWFNATHKAMPVQIGEDFVQPGVISGAHYVVWVVLSVVVLYLAGVF